jgi:hypothetical protein
LNYGLVKTVACTPRSKALQRDSAIQQDLNSWFVLCSQLVIINIIKTGNSRKKEPRFIHRLILLDDSHLIAIGGNGRSGKWHDAEILKPYFEQKKLSLDGMVRKDAGMFVRSGKIFVVFALVAMLGLHWMLLQTVAWTTMLADNLCTHSVKEAVTETFDDKHPCCLCKAIAAGKKTEQKQAFTTQMQRLEFPPAAQNFVLIAPTHFQFLPLANIFTFSFLKRPPTPPPREVLV